MLKLAQIESAFANEQTADILQLVLDFQRAAKVTVGAMKHQSHSSNLLRARRSGKIKRSGVLVQPKGRYTFHGVGCRFEVAGRIIEIDFGPEGRHDGFDSWRLQQYAASAFEWPDLTVDQIKRGLEEMEISGLIGCPEWEPSPHLFYFTEDLSLPILQENRRSKASKRGK